MSDANLEVVERKNGAYRLEVLQDFFGRELVALTVDVDGEVYFRVTFRKEQAFELAKNLMEAFHGE